jgi:general stress protein 26
MSQGDANLAGEVWGHLKKTQTVFLGTVDADKPRVRPVTLIHFEEKLWITTGTADAKVKQIEANPNVEISWYFGDEEKSGSLRFAGTAEIVKDRETKSKVAGTIEWFNVFFKSADDPGYALLRIHPVTCEYMRPGEMKIHRFPL